MTTKAFARRYAEAVFEIAHQDKDFERWQTDLAKLRDLVRDESVRTLLESPKYPADVKIGVISERLQGINTLALNLVRLLIARGSLGITADIAREFQLLYDDYRGIEHAQIITATPIDQDEKQKIKNYLAGQFKKEIIIDNDIDPAIIGGFIARVGDKLMDASVRSRLESLKARLAGSKR